MSDMQPLFRLIALAARFFIIASFCSLPANAGGMTSSGGEFITTENNPWFIGSAPVHYCVVKSDDFSPTLEKSRTAIREVIDNWTATLTALKPIQTEFNLPDGTAKGLTLQFEEVDCVVAHDLTFYLGSFTSEVDSLLEHMARYTAGFAAKSPIDDITGRTPGGAIWLAPDRGARAYAGPSSRDFWSNDATLSSVLAHELGHVFGFAHQADGIMNENFPAEVIAEPLAQKVTSDVLRYSGWYWRHERVCGIVPENASEAIRRILKVPYVLHWKMCLQYLPPEDGFTLRVEFNSELDLVKRTLDARVTTAASNIGPTRSIVGHYFRERLGNPFDYRYHSFLDLGDTELRGFLVLDPAQPLLPLILHSNGPAIQITVIQGSEFFDFGFTVGNVNLRSSRLKPE